MALNSENVDLNHNIDDSHKHNLEQSQKAHTKKIHTYESIYVKFKNKQIYSFSFGST